MMNQQPDQPAHSIGIQLRAAREQQGLTHKEVGRQLKLPASVIESLEDDRTGKIPTVYVKGYVRSYARLLELDEHSLCARLDLSENETQSTPALRPALPTGGNYSWLESTGKVAGYLVVTAFVVAPLVWWFTQGAVRLSFDESLVSSQSEAQPIASGVSNTDGSNDNQSANGGQSADSHLQASAAPFLSLRNNDNNNAEAITQPATSTDAIIDLGLTIDQADDGLDAQSSANIDTDSSIPDEQATVQLTNPDINSDSGNDPQNDLSNVQVIDPDMDQLRIQMLNESWVEITAADGERLEYDLLSAGRIKTYAGKGPFKLLFGQASAVELFLNDEHVDLSPYTRGNVASTTLASNRSSSGSDIPSDNSSNDG